MRAIAQAGCSITSATFLAIATLPAGGSAHAAVVIEGTVDCRDWLDGRANHTADNLEHYALGLLNGLTLGHGREFWRARGTKFSTQQAYQWIDDYCRANPAHQVMTAAGELFRQRTEGDAPSNAKKGR